MGPGFRALLVAAFLGVGIQSAWGFLLESMIFQPARGGAPARALAGIPAEDVFLETGDDVRIHAYWVPSPGADRAVLFLHGNAGNASHRLGNAAALAGLGAHVLLLDYRGYGHSEGRPTEAGVYEDARTALAHLAERGVPPTRTVVFGRSLGGAVAVDLAQDRELAGVMLESTFTSVSDIARGLAGPVGAWLAGRRFESDAKIRRVSAPVLSLHGDRDTLIPIELGRRLFARAPRPVEFFTVAGAGHNDTVLRGGRAYFERIGAFLDDVAPPADAAEARPPEERAGA